MAPFHSLQLFFQSDSIFVCTPVVESTISTEWFTVPFEATPGTVESLLYGQWYQGECGFELSEIATLTTYL